MQRITRREFVKRTAVTSAAFTSLPAILAACGTSTGTGSNKPSKLVVAAVHPRHERGYENCDAVRNSASVRMPTSRTSTLVRPLARARAYALS